MLPVDLSDNKDVPAKSNHLPISTFYSLVNISIPQQIASTNSLTRQTAICTSIFAALGKEEPSVMSEHDIHTLVFGIAQGLSDLSRWLYDHDLVSHRLPALLNLS